MLRTNAPRRTVSSNVVVLASAKDEDAADGPIRKNLVMHETTTTTDATSRRTRSLSLMADGLSRRIQTIGEKNDDDTMLPSPSRNNSNHHIKPSNENDNGDGDDDHEISVAATASQNNNLRFVDTSSSESSNSNSKNTLTPSKVTPALPANPSTQQERRQHHYTSSQPWMKGGVITLWIVVLCFTFYYVKTEQQRRRRRLRRQRQARLEIYTPSTQRQRKLELMQVLQPTSVVVQTKDLILPSPPPKEGGNNYHRLEEDRNNNNDTTTTTTTILQNNFPIDIEQSSNEQRSIFHRDSEDNFSCSLLFLRGYSDVGILTVGSSKEEDDDGECCSCDDSVEESSNGNDNGNTSADNSMLLEEEGRNGSENGETDEEDEGTLQLPTGQAVSATCIICLKRYQPQDLVSWSPNHHHHHHHSPPVTTATTSSTTTDGGHCSHAFHQHCIVEWLAKLPNCNCPVCRTVFCQLPNPKPNSGKGIAKQLLQYSA